MLGNNVVGKAMRALLIGYPPYCQPVRSSNIVPSRLYQCLWLLYEYSVLKQRNCSISRCEIDVVLLKLARVGCLESHPKVFQTVLLADTRSRYMYLNVHTSLPGSVWLHHPSFDVLATNLEAIAPGQLAVWC